jgi:hypothetical protein
MQILIARELEVILEDFKSGFVLDIVSPGITRRRGTAQEGAT